MQLLKTKQLALAGLMAALVMVGTMLIQVPTLTKGYIHIGDSMVYLCGILLGPLIGGLAAAVGSVLADLASGYGIYAPATFMIKGLDAMVVAYIYTLLTGNTSSVLRKTSAFIISVLMGGSVMVFGYLVYESFLYGWAAALLGIAPNMTQAFGGGLLALPLLLALERMGLRQRLQ